MAIIKIKQGDVVPFVVTAVELNVPASNPKYGPSHKFAGRTPTDPDAAVFMSPPSADRQLARLGLTMETVVGQAIEFSRPGEYVDINRYVAPSGTATQSPPAVQHTPAPAAKPAPAGKQPFTSGPPIPGLDTPPAATVDRLGAMFALYRTCLGEAVSASKAIPNVSPEAIAAMTATLFIQANNKGIAA